MPPTNNLKCGLSWKALKAGEYVGSVGVTTCALSTLITLGLQYLLHDVALTRHRGIKCGNVLLPEKNRTELCRFWNFGGRLNSADNYQAKVVLVGHFG